MGSSITEFVAGKREMEDVLVSRFRAYNANSPGSAVDLVPSDPVEADRFDALRAQGVIRGAEGGFFLDEGALEELREQRQGFLYGSAGVAAVLGILAGILFVRRR